MRYLYVPLGGSRYRLLTIFPTFLFVAVWHDLEWRLLGWAALVCLAFVPEIAIKRACAAPRFAALRRTPGYVHAAAAAAAINIAGLMAANLTGALAVAGGGGVGGVVWVWGGGSSVTLSEVTTCHTRTHSHTHTHGHTRTRTHIPPFSPARRPMHPPLATHAGFVLGVDGLSNFLREIIAAPGFVAAALLTFFCAAHLMFGVREREAQQAQRAAAEGGQS